MRIYYLGLLGLQVDWVIVGVDYFWSLGWQRHSRDGRVLDLGMHQVVIKIQVLHVSYPRSVGVQNRKGLVAVVLGRLWHDVVVLGHLKMVETFDEVLILLVVDSLVLVHSVFLNALQRKDIRHRQLAGVSDELALAHFLLSLVAEDAIVVPVVLRIEPLEHLRALPSFKVLVTEL